MGVSTKLMESIWCRALLFVLLMAVFPTYVTTLLGCINSGMAHVYLTTIKDSRVASFSIRVGYFGLCATLPGRTSCTQSAGKSTHQIMTSLGITGSDDLVNIALTLQNRIILYAFVVGGLCYTFGVAALGIAYFSRKNGKLTPKRRKVLLVSSELSLGLCFAALVFTFASALSITQLINGLRWMSTLTNTQIEFSVSRLMLALQWMTASALLLISLGNYLLYGRDHMNRSAASNLADGIVSNRGKSSGATSTTASFAEEGSAPAF